MPSRIRSAVFNNTVETPDAKFVELSVEFLESVICELSVELFLSVRIVTSLAIKTTFTSFIIAT